MFASIGRHLWYLSEELVPLSLCDRGTPDPEKEAIVRVMLEAGRPQQFPPQKPIMKKHLLDNHRRDVVKLHEFAGERSWLIFELLNINADWMQLPPSSWAGSQSFVRFKNLVDSLEVVNDCAERSVKDVTEFINYGKDHGRRDRVKIVVNHHRQLLDFQNLKKHQMDNMDDFL